MKTLPHPHPHPHSTTATTSDLLRPKEAGELLNLHVISLRRYRAQGRLKAYRLPGGGIRYRREDLLKLLEAMES